MKWYVMGPDHGSDLWNSNQRRYSYLYLDKHAQHHRTCRQRERQYTLFYCHKQGTAPVVSTIIVTPHFANGGITCDGPTKTFTITVNPTAQVNQPLSEVLCNGAPTTAVNYATVNSGGTATYTWTNSNSTIGLAGTGSGNIPSFTATNTGTTPVVSTIIVTPHFANGGITCDGPTKTFTITVNPTAQVDQPLSEVVCNGAPTTAVNYATANSGGTATYTWTNATAP